MPNSPSAKKRLRQNAKRRVQNRSAKSRLRTQLKAFRAALAAGDSPAAQLEYRKCASLLDRTAQKGAIHKRNAARNKSRLAAALSRIAPPPAADAAPPEPTPEAQ